MLAGLGVLAFASGSSSIDAVTRFGHRARWVVLALLLAAGAGAAAPALRAVRLPRRAPLAAAALLALAFLSTAWSVAPRLTFERAVSLAILLAAAALVSAVAAARPGLGEAVALGLLAGAVAVGLLGLVVLAAAHGDAVASASPQTPARYRGFGQNPNTASLLFAVVLPIAIWALFAARARLPRSAAAAAVLLLGGSIVASGSRGALVAAAAGSAVTVVALAGSARLRVLGALLVVAALVAGAALQSIPSTSVASAAAATQPVPLAPRGGFRNAEGDYPLDADIGRPLPGGGEPALQRSFSSSSGRADAWRGAVHQTARRPLLGYGFGTEARVFVDRYYRFFGGLPEDSYIGISLQLGIVGLLALLALFATCLLPLPRRPGIAWACVGVVAAGMVMAVVQSYVYSVGNIAAAPLWIAAFLVPALGTEARRAT